MIIVNQGQTLIGEVQVQVVSSLQTGAGILIFADLVTPVAT